MRKSFVFRDAKGRLKGYLMQQEGRISLRIDGGGKDAELTVIREDGRTQTFALSDGRSESSWEDGGGPVVAAYVSQSDMLLMDTGAIAREKYAQLLDGKRRKANVLKQPCAEPKPQRQNKAEPERCSAQRVFPQKRWPPPVLMMHPAYEAGRWMERDGRETEEEEEYKGRQPYESCSNADDHYSS